MNPGTTNKTEARRVLLEASRAAYRALAGTASAPGRNTLPPVGMTLAAIRGRMDTQAFSKRYSDKALHEARRADVPGHENLFDALEQARCDIMGTRDFPGTAPNIIADLEEEIVRTAYDQKPLNHAFLRLGMAIAAGRTIEDAPLGNAWDAWIAKQCGLITLQDFLPLSETVRCQKTYAEKAQGLIRKLHVPESKDDTPEEKPETPDPQPDSCNVASFQEAANLADNKAPPHPKPSKMAPAIKNIFGALYSKIIGPPPETLKVLENPVDFAAADPSESAAYKIYTQEFDEIVHASSLIKSPEIIAQLWNRFQAGLQKDGVHSARLINQLQRRLQSRLNIAYDFDQEEGILDPARLPGVITDPFNSRIYRHMSPARARDTVVTLLLDNSGSMRGRPMLIASMTAYQLAAALERCSIKSEVLGFTTRNWAGGKSHEKWLRDGKPRIPGRLNDLRHIIYKPASMPMRRAKHNFAVVLEENILKENIDGEALMWAYERLLRCPETRRILIVLSDGAPLDEKTQHLNPRSYLDTHLKQVIQRIENEKLVELSGIGIGHDTGKYYKKSLTLNDIEDIAKILATHIGDILDPVDGNGRVIRKRQASGRAFHSLPGSRMTLGS